MRDQVGNTPMDSTAAGRCKRGGEDSPKTAGETPALQLTGFFRGDLDVQAISAAQDCQFGAHAGLHIAKHTV